MWIFSFTSLMHQTYNSLLINLKRYRRVLIFTLFHVLLFISFLRLSAQQPENKIDPETLKLIKETADLKGLETGALIILKDYQFTIDEKGLSKLVLRVFGKVYNKQSRSDYSQIPLGYNSYYEEAALDFARVIHNDGTIREVPKDAIQIKTTPDSRGGVQYTDNRYLSFALSGLEIGTAFEYQATFIQKVAVIDGEWFDNHWFACMLQNISPPYSPRIDPVISTRYTLRVPKGTEFQYYLSSGSEKPKKKSSNGQDEYVWEFSNLPAIKIEGGMPQLSKLNPVLIISSLKDWTQLDLWASKKLLSKTEITKDISSKANELTLNAKSDYEKIKSVSDYIQNNIQYVYADLEHGGYTPHTPSEILSSHYGDCKDQTILLITMLKAIGIEAFPALINPYPYDDFSEIPTPYFSHLITYIPRNEGDIWLDMTSSVTPFPNLFFSDQNRSAFIVNNKGGKLVKTPGSGAKDNTSSFDLQSSFDKGIADICMVISTCGAQSDALKLAFKESNEDEKEQFFRNLVTSYVEKANIDSIIISDVRNPEVSFNAIIKYHLDSLWKEGQNMFTFGSHAFLPLAFLANADTRSYSAKRYNDIEGIYLYSTNGSETYVPPSKDLLPIILPSDDSIKNEFFQFNRNFTKKGNSIIVKWTLVNNELYIPKEKYESYVNSFKDLKTIATWNIDYVEPLSFVKKVFQSDDPISILNYCTNVLNHDSTNILSLLLRGIAYHQLANEDSSANDFLNALKLAPKNKYAHFWVSYPLVSMNKTSSALANLDAAIQIDPNFEEAYFSRGLYYINQNLLEKGLADFARVVKLNPKNDNGWRSMGYVLRELKRNKESIISFQEAIRLDSTNSWSYSGIAETYRSMDLYQKAVDFYLLAIKYSPMDSRNYGNLGWTYYLLNNDQKCIEYSLKASALDSTAYYARYNIALANLRSGNISEARKLYMILSDEAKSIPENYISGAVQDLYNLKTKGIYFDAICAILKDFFGK
jgi:tetratricopeptide (TPR) repeat protein